MASEYLQDLAFQQLSHAIMATANSVAGANNNAAAPSESSIFDVMRRKLGKVQDVIQGIAAPLKRRSMYEELPEHVWPQPEQIEMSHIVLPGHGIGHVFVPCQLSNPTWCDFCGDFIWGLYKQCLRCNKISERMPQALGRESAMVSDDFLQTWFLEHRNNIRSVDPALLTSPDRIYNADETGFQFAPQKTVLAPVIETHPTTPFQALTMYIIRKQKMVG